MIDQFGRKIDYLRVSITDRCNLRCRYCMPEDLPFIPHEKILRYEEILRFCGLAAQEGIRHIKVTGGEPLVRKGCIDFLKALKGLPGIEHVTLTTNGVLLKEAVPQLLELGLDGINISLDTLNPDTYEKITGKNQFHQVWEGMMEAVRGGLRVKINCVPQMESTPEEWVALATLCRDYPIDLRFIELMPIGSGRGLSLVKGNTILTALREAFPGLVLDERPHGFGPARYYTAPGFQGAVGFIDAVSNCFCEGCNRVRLTSEGFLKLCLSHPDGVDFRTLLRSGATDQEIRKAFREAVFKKPRRHQFELKSETETPNMSQIGG